MLILFKCWIWCTFVILFFVFRQFRLETINRFFFNDERFVRDSDASLNDVELNDCKNEKINSKFCEIDFVREIDLSTILKTSNRNSRWKQQFDHVNKIIAITFNSLIFMHMRKWMCTLYLTKHKIMSFLKND